jgi:ubiquinone/menaquinone biosynthesis C-methylase UbiE
MQVQQQVSTFERSKQKLMQVHNQWLEKNNPEILYNHVIHRSRVDQILDCTADICGKVLDIGCFDGFITEKMIEQGNKEVIGMDRLEKALEIADKRGIKTVLGDVDNAYIPFPDNYFDCVVAADVFNSVYDADAALEEIARVLKPNGKFILTIPNLTSCGNRLLMLFGSAPYNLEVRARQGAGHLRLYTFKTMRSLLEDCQFAIENMSSTVCAFPLIRLLPIKPEYQQPRIFFSKFLARLFPKWGESIVVLAENRKA